MIRALAVLCAALLLPLTGCENDCSYDQFDAGTEGIVDVVTEIPLSDDDAEAETGYGYYTLADNRRAMLTEPFAPDATVYRVPQDCFEARVDREKGKVMNRLRRVALQTEDGEPVPTGADIENLFRCLEALEHDLASVDIFESGGEYFACVGLNVNWNEPYALYYFDRAGDRLTLLYRWEGERVTGLRVRSLEPLKG